MSEVTRDENRPAVEPAVAEGRGTVYARSSTDKVGTTDANATETAKLARASEDADRKEDSDGV